MTKLFYFLSFLSLTSCVSVEKYNVHIDEKIEVEKLRNDVDFTKNKLLKKQVDIDLYYSKDVLSNRLDSFKNTIQQPMKPNDFSRELSKVVSTFGHGHTVVMSLNKRATKEERKKYKDSKGPFSQLEIKSFDNHLYLNTNYSKDSTLVEKAEILAINGVNYSDFYQLYHDYRKGDGYIKTLNKYMLSGAFLRYVNNEIGIVDSVELKMQKNDSIFTQIVKREFKKKKVKKDDNLTKKDSVADQPKIVKEVKKLTKEEKNRKKDLEKYKSDVKKYFVYNKIRNDYQREIIFPNKEDSTTAILQIKTFSLRHSKKAYPFIFDSINKLKVKNLILDLRNNGGGYVSDANYLYSFLTTTNQPKAVMADKMKVNSKFSVTENLFNKLGYIGNTIGLPFALYHYSKTLFNTKKEKDGNYYYKATNKKDLLNQPKKYQGNIYVLTNGMSYSATCILGAALQNEGKAVFVGEETGGDYNGTVAGSFADFKLKNAKIGVFYGLLDFKPNTSRELKGRGIIPDVAIETNFNDIVNEKDPQLDWILNDIKTKK